MSESNDCISRGCLQCKTDLNFPNSYFDLEKLYLYCL